MSMRHRLLAGLATIWAAGGVVAAVSVKAQ